LSSGIGLGKKVLSSESENRDPTAEEFYERRTKPGKEGKNRKNQRRRIQEFLEKKVPLPFQD